MSHLLACTLWLGLHFLVFLYSSALGIGGPCRAAVNIRRTGGEKGEAQQGFISSVFSVCRSASQSPGFPSIFFLTLSDTYPQDSHHISFPVLKERSAHLHFNNTLSHSQFGRKGIEKGCKVQCLNTAGSKCMMDCGLLTVDPAFTHTPFID